MNKIKHSLFGEWRHLVEKPVGVEQVKKVVEKGSIPVFGFFFMLGASGIIATLGYCQLNQIWNIYPYKCNGNLLIYCSDWYECQRKLRCSSLT